MAADTAHTFANGEALAALTRERKRLCGRRAGVVLSGGNVDLEVIRQVLNGHTPQVPAASMAAAEG